jgi:hypothetical protein
MALGDYVSDPDLSWKKACVVYFGGFAVVKAVLGPGCYVWLRRAQCLLVIWPR